MEPVTVIEPGLVIEFDSLIQLSYLYHYFLSWFIAYIGRNPIKLEIIKSDLQNAFSTCQFDLGRLFKITKMGLPGSNTHVQNVLFIDFS